MIPFVHEALLLSCQGEDHGRDKASEAQPVSLSHGEGSALVIPGVVKEVHARLADEVSI